MSSLTVFREAFAQAEQSFADALPATVAKSLTPERLIKITLATIGRNPKLAQCSKESILRCVLDAASLGLEPSGGALGHAYLVPYGREATLIIGYRGYIALARRSGEISSVEAHVVYSGDEFEIEFGSSPRLAHRPKLVGDRGDIVAAYCVATLSDGVQQTEVMTRAEIDTVRKRSRASANGPWQTDFAEMARKTVVRRAAKYWPLSVELARALDVDDQDFSPTVEVRQPAALTPGRHSVRQQQPEAPQEAEPQHDPETGVVDDLPDWKGED